jgi:hypothetical protein
VVLDRDPRANPDELLKTAVDTVFVDGAEVYRRGLASTSPDAGAVPA